MKVYLKKVLGNYFLNELLKDGSVRDYFKEIGTIISDNEIKFIINTTPNNHGIINKIAKNTFENELFLIYSFLNLMHGINYKIKFINKKFTQRDIQSFTYHYFIPEISTNKYLFKYLPDNKYLKPLLLNNSLWFGNPLKFSDITDCKFEIDTEASKESILDFYYKLHIKENVKKNKILKLEEFSDDFILPSIEKFNSDLLDHHHKGVFSKLGITCFSEKYDNKLMWDSYTSGSQGICLIFDTTVLKEKYFEFNRRKVRYFKTLPKYFYDATGIMEIGHIICSKTKDYSYENEVREFINFQFEENINRNVEFNPRALKGIIFGAKCSDKTKRKIQKLISHKKYEGIELIESYMDNKFKVKLTKNKIL